MTSTTPSLAGRDTGTRLWRARTPPGIFVGFLQSPPWREDSVARLEILVHRSVCLPAEHERQLQGEGLARVGGRESGQLRCLAEPVAHGVGVDEQDPGRRLQGLTVLEVRRER